MVYKKPPLTQHESSNRTNVAHTLKKICTAKFHLSTVKSQINGITLNS